MDVEALGGGGLHFGDGARGFWIDIGSGAMASVHYECSLVHASLRSGYEVKIWGPASPCGVDKSIGVKYRFEILPLTRISVESVSPFLGQFTINNDNPPESLDII